MRSPGGSAEGIVGGGALNARCHCPTIASCWASQVRKYACSFASSSSLDIWYLHLGLFGTESGGSWGPGGAGVIHSCLSTATSLGMGLLRTMDPANALVSSRKHLSSLTNWLWRLRAFLAACTAASVASGLFLRFLGCSDGKGASPRLIARLSLSWAFRCFPESGGI